MDQDNHVLTESVEKAKLDIARTNRFLRIMGVVAAVVLIVLGAYTLYRIDVIAGDQRQFIIDQTQRNTELLKNTEREALEHRVANQTNHDEIQFLICEIIMATRQPTDGMREICTPILNERHSNELPHRNQDMQ